MKKASELIEIHESYDRGPGLVAKLWRLSTHALLCMIVLELRAIRMRGISPHPTFPQRGPTTWD